MYTKQLCSWILGLGIGFCLTLSPCLAMTPAAGPTGSLLTRWQVADADLDGVDDSVDLCPGTASGLPVNVYGCPLSISVCDYTTSTVMLTSAGGSTGGTTNTRYVLASNTGTILQVSTTPSFTGLTGTATYMALGLTYDGTVSNLSVGNSLSSVSASCMDWSDALVFKACVPPVPACDYQVGDVITLQSTGGSSGVGVKTTYILTDASGKLVTVSSTASFLTTALPAGDYKAYALTYTDDSSITGLVANGTNTLSQVSASCLAVSSAYSLTLCGGCLPQCAPIQIVRIR
ncbi:hypothetical protein [Spirosoma aerophilum]